MYKIIVVLFVFTSTFVTAKQADNSLKMLDIFEMEFASDPQISPDGKSIIYVRNFMDIMADKQRGNLWQVSADGKQHQPLTSGMVNDFSPRYSPDGKRIAYQSTRNGKPQIFIRWLDTQREFQVAQLQFGASDLSWSNDGKWLAFSQFVPSKPTSLATMPSAPEGAKWAEASKIIDKVTYRADGAGYVKPGFNHLFVVTTDGGTPRQVTNGDFHHRGNIAWTSDNSGLIFSANRRDDWAFEPLDSSIYKLNIHSKKLTKLTQTYGPENSPVISPNGKLVAYTGFQDKHQGYQLTELYIMKTDGSGIKLLTKSLDRSVKNIKWSGNDRLYFQYDDGGDTKIVRTNLKGKRKTVTQNVGGTSFGRPYSSGSFSVNRSGLVAFTHTSTRDLAQVATITGTGNKSVVLTDLNNDLLKHRDLAKIEEINVKSSHDGWNIQGWLAKPANFDPSKKYPLILEIHGGPFANYGLRFSPEVQLYAAAGYMVLYANPRGSTGYGLKFGNAIHHAYPGFDYDDLMSLVDSVVASGNVDSKQLFVTGGSGGGVLTSWIVGKTNRFAAAVVAKPVINWTSFVLTADFAPYFTKYWFDKMPWDDNQTYWKRSPLSLVGKVTTPTMLLTGEADYRTPISETEQYYQALKLRGVDSIMVRIPNASHGITKRPSNLIAKVSNILAWFEKYRIDKGTELKGQ